VSSVRAAVIDVGTNSILLTIADVDGASGDVRVVDDRCRIERLGRGVDKSGVLDEAAIARALDAMREYAGAIRAAGATRVAAVGTQALREARNGAAFLGPARELLGVDIEVIGGRREAELAFGAVLKSFPGYRSGPLVGTAGTATTIAAVAVELEPYDPDRVQGMRVSRVDVDAQLRRYLGMTTAGRGAIRGLDPKRADVIHAGCAIVSRVMARMDAETLVVSDRGIRFGLLAEVASAT
jgi:exopolyphosphatase/pppGpp-phosphohydrolase